MTLLIGMHIRKICGSTNMRRNESSVDKVKIINGSVYLTSFYSKKKQGKITKTSKSD